MHPGVICVPQHVSAQQRSQYWMVPPAPVEWHIQPVLGSLLGCKGFENPANPCEVRSSARLTWHGSRLQVLLHHAFKRVGQLKSVRTMRDRALLGWGGRHNSSRHDIGRTGLGLD